MLFRSESSKKLTGQIFDLRRKEAFKKGFVKGSINVPYNDKFLQFAGWYINYDEPMTIIGNPDDSTSLQKDLASIGFDNLELIISEEQASQYFDASYENISPEEFVELYEDKKVLDVRSAAEYKDGNLSTAAHIHFGQLDNKDIPFNQDDTIFVHCQSGVRSAIAMSVLKARGFENVINVEKGYAGIKAAMK